MKGLKDILPSVGAVASAFIASMCWVLPMVVLSLGLGGFGLSYVAFLAPYQRYFQFFAVIALFWAHYRMEKVPVNRWTEILVWSSTILVTLLMLSPLLARMIF